MKNLKKIIIILGITVAVLTILIIVILNKEIKEEKVTEYENQVSIKLEEGIFLVNNKREYFAISNKINSYLQETNEMEENELYSADKMYCIKKSFDFYTYYVSGVIKRFNKETIEEENTYYVFLLDRDNMTYQIKNAEEIQDEGIIQKKLEEYKEIDIEVKDNNTIQFTEVSDENMSRAYITDYKSNMLYNPQKAYEMLDEEYRNKRFGNIENYKTYINENIDTIRKMTMQKYRVDNKDGYNQYIIIDNNNNYYIFKEKAIMQYSVIADTHTIDLAEFTKKYNSVSEIEKVGMNIEKIMDALNTKDYAYVYSKLADSYKRNNFPSFESFKEYAINMFYGVNSVEYIEYTIEGNNYLYSVIFKDRTGKVIIEIEKTLIMQLKDNNDFIFSFNLDNDGLIDENPDEE